MNSRERFVRCNLFKDVDHAPFVEIAAWPQTIARWLKEGLPADVDSCFYLNGNEFFGFERWEFIPLRTDLIPMFEYEVLEENERIIVYRGYDGVVHKALKEGVVGGTRMSMDQYISFPVTDRESFYEMKKRYNPHSPVRYPRWWNDLVRCWKSRDYPLALTGFGGFGLYSMLRRWMGTENACTVFYDDPSFAEEMLDFLAEFFMQLTERALKDVDVDWYNYFEDFAYKTGPLVSPYIFEKFLLPRYKIINAYLMKHGVRIISLDSDGNIEVLLPLIIEAGFNHICPVEQAAGMDAVKIRKTYGRDLAMLGSIDKREIAKGKKEIERELLRQVPYLLETGGYIPTIDHSIPPDVSYKNFMYYLEFKKKLLSGVHGS
ncbi:MAG TPA: uroporphyrinogen decarboxylase family protein [bacterium]|nr:uroporphyrinogen decarboxylase family protein [bacterium]HOL35328.1 uroporphyrinogen decarboxylase family protein [bacterium]HPP08731.1 uroporphyrinogen decarboxylase family protein [bacterium]